MSVLDRFKDKRTPKEKELARINKKLTSSVDERAKRDEKIAKCYVNLKECDRSFEDTITVQSAAARKLEALGASSVNERNRIKQAAMGRVVVKRALIQLESISSEEDLNNAIDLLGMAIRQMHRIDNFSTDGVSEWNKNAVKKTLPDNQDSTVFDLPIDGNYEIPPEIANKIDESFVDDLLDGKDFDECLKTGAVGRRAYTPSVAAASAARDDGTTSESFNRFADKM